MNLFDNPIARSEFPYFVQSCIHLLERISAQQYRWRLNQATLMPYKYRLIGAPTGLDNPKTSLVLRKASMLKSYTTVAVTAPRAPSRNSRVMHHTPALVPKSYTALTVTVPLHCSRDTISNTCLDVLFNQHFQWA